ncbi:MAG: DNA polymerase-2 [Gammaproteobacteria bacterium]|jgi:DNA polymerase-2
MSEADIKSAEGSAQDFVAGCLLTRQWRDTNHGLELTFWLAAETGPVRVVVGGERAVCFADREAVLPPGIRCERRELSLLNMLGNPVDGVYFSRQRDLRDAASACRAMGIGLHESDLKPSDRYLMERFVTGAMAVSGTAHRHERYVEYRDPQIKRSEHHVALRWISLDIETQGLDGALYSIAVTGEDFSRVFVLSEYAVRVGDCDVVIAADESALLGAFFAWLETHDPDLILGWNVVNFDLDYLQNKCKELRRPFAFGRGGEAAAILAPSMLDGPRVARLPGRVALDGIELLRAAFWSFENFGLENVARELLGRGKKIEYDGSPVEAIDRLYAEDRAALVAYNVEDCRLVADIFEHAGLIEFAQRRSELTGLALDRQGGSVAAFDNLYLPRLHRAGRVAPSVADVSSTGASPGGYVLDSQPGLYDNVLLLDFKSLYPSIIRTFQIDPLGLVAAGEHSIPGFKGAQFARENAILPQLIEELWAERERAKRENDAPMSQAVKILMNSFYGVLGASGCRFHDARLASSITLRGHEIINRSRERIETLGHQVIYGDTDSLFVLLGAGVSEDEARARGNELVVELNSWWRANVEREFDLPCHLEIEFETHFLRFLMPTVRGELTGSKKRYAGLVRGQSGQELVFKGLESVRTDWTPLARRFQRELYRRVFVGEPCEPYVQETLTALLSGALDEELIYRKRLRRRVEDYTRNVPPHVQAARKLGRPVRWIRYMMTRNGPEPVLEREPLPRPDYAHYRERQLAPAADGILHFLDTSFAQITDQQIELF